MTEPQQFLIYQSEDGVTRIDVLLEAEIDDEVWATLNSDTSRAFEKPKFGRIAMKLINHLEMS